MCCGLEAASGLTVSVTHAGLLRQWNCCCVPWRSTFPASCHVLVRARIVSAQISVAGVKPIRASSVLHVWRSAEGFTPHLSFSSTLSFPLDKQVDKLRQLILAEPSHHPCSSASSSPMDSISPSPPCYLKMLLEIETRTFCLPSRGYS